MSLRRTAAFVLTLVSTTGIGGGAEPEVWTIRDDGRTRDFILWPGGAGVFLDGSARGVRGFWHDGEDQRVLFLEDGGAFTIRPSRLGWTISEFSKRPAEDRLRVERVEGPPTKWIGSWIWRTADGRASRHVSLASDGHAISAPGPAGKWMPVSRGIRVEWEDGAIDLLQFDGDTPTLRSWLPGVVTRSTPPLETRPLRAGAEGFTISP